MIKWVLVISIFSPHGEFLRKYTEGPILSQQACEARRMEFRELPTLMGEKIKAQCLRIKDESAD